MTARNYGEQQYRRANDERTVVLEQRVNGLHATVERVETKIDGIVDALAGIVRIEERQIANAARISDCVVDIEKHDQRLGAIENQMPGLNEKAKWVVMVLIGVAGGVGVAALALVIK